MAKQTDMPLDNQNIYMSIDTYHTHLNGGTYDVY